ncbi:3878_t:CDS:2, partial [Acaulospora colombiana]
VKGSLSDESGVGVMVTEEEVEDFLSVVLVLEAVGVLERSGEGVKIVDVDVGDGGIVRASVTNYPPPAGCNFLRVTDPTNPCYFNPKTATNSTVILNKTYIGGVESYTVVFAFQDEIASFTSVAVRNGLLDGSLMSADGKTVIKTFNNATRMKVNPNADGDIFAISEFLAAAKADLDAPSTAPGANKSIGETYRSSGIVIVVLIEYSNVVSKPGVISYKYMPQVIDGNEYKNVESIYNSDGSYTLVERHGHVYEGAKFEETDDFSDIRKNLKTQESET